MVCTVHHQYPGTKYQVPSTCTKLQILKVYYLVPVHLCTSTGYRVPCHHTSYYYLFVHASTLYYVLHVLDI
jgi:hypothetical protein